MPTAFNFLGPLANPAQPGVRRRSAAPTPRMAPIMAEVLAGRGRRALVFRGDDGLDELTTTTTSRVWVVGDGAVASRRSTRADLGIAPVVAEACAVGRGYNAEGRPGAARRRAGPVRDAVLLNAGAALAAYEPLPGDITSRIRTGMDRAAEAIDSGAAKETLDRWIAACAEVRG